MPAVIVLNRGRGAMQVARAGVIAEAGPVVQHVVEGRLGECAHLGEARHETLVIGDDRRYLGLLQHDLGDPHAIGSNVPLPGQILASVAVEPREQCRAYSIGVTGGVRRGPRRGGAFHMNGPFT